MLDVFWLESSLYNLYNAASIWGHSSNPICSSPMDSRSGLQQSWAYFWKWVSLVTQMVKNLPAMQETWVWSLVWEKSPEGKSPTPVFLPEEFQGQKSLEGYSPWGRRVRHDWVTSTHRLLSPCFAVVVFKFFCMCFTSLYFIYFCCLNISPLSSCI